MSEFAMARGDHASVTSGGKRIYDKGVKRKAPGSVCDSGPKGKRPLCNIAAAVPVLTLSQTMQPSISPKMVDDDVLTHADILMQFARKRPSPVRWLSKAVEPRLGEDGPNSSSSIWKNIEQKAKVSQFRTGTWTADENERFHRGYELHGPKWKAVSEVVRTRSPSQVESRAKSFINKMNKRQVKLNMLKQQVREETDPDGKPVRLTLHETPSRIFFLGPTATQADLPAITRGDLAGQSYRLFQLLFQAWGGLELLKPNCQEGSETAEINRLLEYAFGRWDPVEQRSTRRGLPMFDSLASYLGAVQVGPSSKLHRQRTATLNTEMLLTAPFPTLTVPAVVQPADVYGKQCAIQNDPIVKIENDPSGMSKMLRPCPLHPASAPSIEVGPRIAPALESIRSAPKPTAVSQSATNVHQFDGSAEGNLLKSPKALGGGGLSIECKRPISPQAPDATSIECKEPVYFQAPNATIPMVKVENECRLSSSSTDIDKSAPPSKKNKSNAGPWSQEERLKFMDAFEIHGPEWQKIADIIGTRTKGQVEIFSLRFINELQREQSSFPYATSDVTEIRGGMAKCSARFIHHLMPAPVPSVPQYAAYCAQCKKFVPWQMFFRKAEPTSYLVCEHLDSTHVKVSQKFSKYSRYSVCGKHKRAFAGSIPPGALELLEKEPN